MTLLKRDVENSILKMIKPGKVCLLLGARRVGKTVLIKEISKKINGEVMYLNGEDMDTQSILLERSISNYRRLLKGKDALIIDEAQVIRDIGKILKLMVDEIKDLKIIATGSSGFDLLNKSGEPLTGRSILFHLFPLSQSEYNQIENLLETRQNLPERLIYGGYPELLTYNENEEKQDYLKNIIHTYLLKDILALDGIRNASKIFDLLKMIAYQLGKEVSYNELSNKLGISKNTVEKYLDLLCKVFILFRTGGYNQNLRKEISKGNKWYFFDNGIRNAIISDFRPLSVRRDIGELWENYFISERVKYNSCRNYSCNYFFWRTYDQQEIDFVEEQHGQLSAFEIKWGNKKVKVPKIFLQSYPEAKFAVINPSNYLEWIVKKTIRFLSENIFV